MSAEKRKKSKTASDLAVWCSDLLGDTPRAKLVKAAIVEFDTLFCERRRNGWTYECIDPERLEVWIEARLFQAYDAGHHNALHG